MDDIPWKISYPSEYMQRNNCYLINGKEYERVTNVLNVKAKPGLRYWYGKVGNTKAKSILHMSGQFGSTFHQIIDWILNGVDVDLSNYKIEMQDAIIAWRDHWLNLHDVKVEGTEVPLFDSDLQCAGTCDFIGLVDGKRLIGDWKTSGAIYETYWTQLAAYAMMFKKLSNVDVDGIFIVRVHDGVVADEQYATWDEVETLLYPGFLHHHHLNEWSKEIKEWKPNG